MADAPRASARVASKCVELWGCLAYSSNALRSTRPAETITWRSKAMNPLNNHRQSLILGIVVSLLLAFAIGGFSFNELGLARWFHIVSGGFWIGLLYYFKWGRPRPPRLPPAARGGRAARGVRSKWALRPSFRFRWEPWPTRCGARACPGRGRGGVIAREEAALCGRPWAEETFRRLGPQVRLGWRASDRERIAGGETLCEIAGPARAVLTGERTALNFLQLLSATATVTRRFVEAVAGTGCRILDTRKTLPGLRSAQKYAVRCGGGDNHRIGLYDQVLIKENHIAAAGSLTGAIEAARRTAPGLKVEVEVESLAELEEALGAAPDIIMLDDFSLADMRTAVSLARARSRAVELEASGSVSLETVREIAATGVDYVSVGSLTKHVRAVDLSMRLDSGGG